MQSSEFHNIHLRRIWWALDSPSFLKLPDSVVYFKNATHRREVFQVLKELDLDGPAIDRHFDALGAMPMGRYFEQLLIYALQVDPYYEVMEHNVQIVENKITRGELDLILFDATQKEYLHWEVALKYYLQVGLSGDHDNFLGPSKRDFLGRKMKKLRQNQLPLSRHPQIRDRYGAIKSQVFLKGQLFYPHGGSPVLPDMAEPQAPVFHFMELAQLKALEGQYDHRFKVLKKPYWLGINYFQGEHALRDFPSVCEELKVELSRIDRPQMLGLFKKLNGGFVETERIFICPQGWPLNRNDAID